MKPFLLMLLFVAASFFMISCSPPETGNNAGNKPANGANNAAATAASTASAEADVKKMLADFSAALNKGDAAALDKMYADDYTLIDANGMVHTKTARLEAIKSGKLKFENLTFDEIKVKVSPGGDAAVATAHVTGKTTADGKTTDNNSRVTWAIGKMKDGWRFVAAQITDIKGDAKPADKAEDKAGDKAGDKADDKGGDKKDAPANTAEKKP